MKKWIVAIIVMAFIVSETSCAVRVRERRQPIPPPHRARAIVVY